MIVRETSVGPTPAGGVRSDIVYLDDQRRPVDKSKATMAIIREFDREGKIVRETFGFIGRVDK